MLGCYKEMVELFCAWNVDMASKFVRFVIFLNTVEGKKASEELIRNHISFLRKLDREEKLVMCGPFTDRRGGMIVLKAASIEEAKQIAANDPFVQEGVRSFEVRSWELSCEENNHMGMG